MDIDGIPVANYSGSFERLTTFDQSIVINNYYLGCTGFQMTEGDFALKGSNTLRVEGEWIGFDTGSIPYFQENQVYSFSNTSDYYLQLQGLDVSPSLAGPSNVITSIPGYANVEAPRGVYFDLGDIDYGEHDQVMLTASRFSGFELPVVIDSVSFHLDEDTTATSGTFIDFKIRLSTASTTAEIMSKTLADNVGSDMTTVFSGLLTMSSPGGVGSPSSAFDIVVPFATPFTYDPTLGDLLFEWV